METLLLLTGHLARPSLERVMDGMPQLPFQWRVHDLGLQVAGLMTAEMIRRRLPRPEGVDRILVPGRCRGDLEALSEHYGLPVERGPEELKDLPSYFKQQAQPLKLDAHQTLILAEIVDAPRLEVDRIVERGLALRAEGADVIDLGCLPETPFPHLEEAVQALVRVGLQVSVDSLQPEDLLRGARAGARHLLSLNLDTLWVLDRLDEELGTERTREITPVLIGRRPEDEASLLEAAGALQRRGQSFLVDPILDPIPFGLAASLARYHRLATEHPELPILMGVGNVTELTEADTTGIHALLFGVIAELGIRAVLTTQVSPHCRTAVREADRARRIMHAAHTHRTLPKGLDDGLLSVHARHPHPDTPEEIEALAAQVRDPNFRVQVAADGIHVYNRDGHQVVQDPFVAWPRLQLEGDASHAFYMGVELARAQIAWQLGKRHVQDQPLRWGVAATVPAQDSPHLNSPRTVAPDPAE